MQGVFGESANRGSRPHARPEPGRDRLLYARLRVDFWCSSYPHVVALVASSSWSHAFLTAKNTYLWPDTPSDREMLADLEQGNYAAWSKRTTAQLEGSGQHELINWACMLGAMEELNGKPEVIDFVETNVLTSNKCFATFKV